MSLKSREEAAVKVAKEAKEARAVAEQRARDLEAQVRELTARATDRDRRLLAYTAQEHGGKAMEDAYKALVEMQTYMHATAAAIDSRIAGAGTLARHLADGLAAVPDNVLADKLAEATAEVADLRAAVEVHDKSVDARVVAAEEREIAALAAKDAALGMLRAERVANTAARAKVIKIRRRMPDDYKEFLTPSAFARQAQAKAPQLAHVLLVDLLDLWWDEFDRIDAERKALEEAKAVAKAKQDAAPLVEGVRAAVHEPTQVRDAIVVDRDAPVALGMGRCDDCGTTRTLADWPLTDGVRRCACGSLAVRENEIAPDPDVDGETAEPGDAHLAARKLRDDCPSTSPVAPGSEED